MERIFLLIVFCFLVKKQFKFYGIIYKLERYK